MSHREAVVRSVLERAGRTFADQAGFTLRDKPSALWQLAVMSILLAKPISADLAVAACSQLRRAGGNTPDGMLALSWQERVDACVRAHYRRFDESTATRMDQAAKLVNQRWKGDLRRLAEEADGDVRAAARLLQEIPGIGQAGADIFCREVQSVWSWVRPYFDERALDGARAIGLPADAQRLGELVSDSDLARFAAALVRVTLDEELAAAVR